MIQETINQLPQPYQKDIQRVVEILKAQGCSDIFLFGSLAHGEIHEQSDIDLAVRGCPPSNYFHAWGQLLMTLDCSVDLVNLDLQQDFADFLAEQGELLQIA